MESSSATDRVTATALPAFFVRLGTKRWLLALAALTAVSGLAMQPAMMTMEDHGASVIAFEFAGSVGRSQEILAEWSAAGEAAAWWQLGLDVAFLVGYGLLLAGACAAVAGRAEPQGKAGLVRAAGVVVWFGPVAAAADMLQNISLGLILAGEGGQPWPAISLLCGAATGTLMASGIVFALVGWLRTRASA